MSIIFNKKNLLQISFLTQYIFYFFVLLIIVPALFTAFLYHIYGVATALLLNMQKIKILTSIRLHRNKICNFLLFYIKHSLIKFNILIDIVVCDLPGKIYRFIITYQLLSMKQLMRAKIITYTNEILSVPSITRLFYAAAWLEREVWDTYGIFFKDNFDLRRILSDYGFYGHPFRKDFPLIGFCELQYNEIDQVVKYDIVEQSAEYRRMHWGYAWNKF